MKAGGLRVWRAVMISIHGSPLVALRHCFARSFRLCGIISLKTGNIQIGVRVRGRKG